MSFGKLIRILLLAVILSAGRAQALGDADLKKARELYVSRGCIACHQNPELTKAPALSAVSAKYAANKGALEQLKASLAKGSIGKWGALEMPPQAHVSEAERELLARWVLGLHAAKEKPPLSEVDASWSKFSYHGAGQVAANLDAAGQELSLRNQVGAVAGFRQSSRRNPGDAVILTVKKVRTAGKPWGQVGVMISAVAEPRLLGSGAKYEWIIRRETNGKTWDYRVRKDVGTGNYELYSSGPIDPAKPVTLEIVRNGDNYEFRANGKLHYATGDNVDDVYTTATKDAMVYQSITIGGSGVFDATIASLNGGASLIHATNSPPEAPLVAQPAGEKLLIERRNGNVIEIVDKPLVYRTYVHGIPSRAIAVGLPSKVSYAFDADGCRLAYAWSGGFLDVTKSWTGFGGWYSKLLGEKFYEAPPGFPLRIGDPGKEPTLRFRGYDLQDGLPTFKYLVDGQLVRHGIKVTAAKAIAHSFELPGNKEPVYFLGKDGAFASADAEWKDGRWAVASEKSERFSMGVVQ